MDIPVYLQPYAREAEEAGRLFRECERCMEALIPDEGKRKELEDRIIAYASYRAGCEYQRAIDDTLDAYDLL